MAFAGVVETSVANSPSQDSNHPDHLFQGILLVGSNHFLISNLFIVQQLISFWTRQQQRLRGRQKLYPRVVLILLRLFLVFRDVKSAVSIQKLRCGRQLEIVVVQKRLRPLHLHLNLF